MIGINKVILDPRDDNNVDKIYQVKDQIKNFVKKRHLNNKDDYVMLYANICNVLSFWAEFTWVGIPKEKNQKKAFQAFFVELYGLLVSDLFDGDNYLYQGTLYRYLGHGSQEEESAPAIIPEYNDIYVSWSKKPENKYLESKLYGKMTHLTCELTGDFYGIDLTAFEVDRPGEEEVVFPTIESTIKSIVII